MRSRWTAAKDAKPMETADIAALIDASPMNRGMVGADWLSDPANIAIEMHGNVMLFERDGEYLFQFHWLALDTKGRQAINDTREAMRRVFRDTGVRAIYGFVSYSLRESALMARWIGARYCGSLNTQYGPCQIFVVTPEILEGLKK